MRWPVLLVLAAQVLLFGSGLHHTSGREDRDEVPNELPATDLPVVREHTYRMAGKIRLLLLWVGRNDVGSGVIRWKASNDASSFELLIGSDPSKAPGQLNKWGYLVEETRSGNSTVVGVISQDNEDGLDDVKAGLANQRHGRPFDTIRGRVGLTQARARVGMLYAPSHLTYHEAPAVLKMVLEDRSKAIKRLDRSAGVRAGFLSSLTELVTSSIQAAERRTPASLREIPYVHGDRIYRLRLLEATSLKRFERDGQVFENVIRGRFDTGRADQRSATRFELVYGASGPLAGIPILVSYQPKWWLQVDLVLQK